MLRVLVYWSARGGGSIVNIASIDAAVAQGRVSSSANGVSVESARSGAGPRNPLGLGHTVTAGIISSTERNLSGVDPEEGRQIEFLQTDTAINPGSSGGPLITLGGAWVGVNTAGYVQAQNIGFAVPNDQVHEFIDEVLAR